MIHEPTFWVLVAFLIFIGLIGKKVWVAACTALDSRSEKIKADLDEAEKLREEAQDLLAQYQRKQRDATRETEELVTKARAEAEKYAEQAKENLTKALARREQLALDRIAYAEKNAIEDVRRLAVDVAIEATRKILSDEMKGARADKLIDNSINELPNKLH